MMKDPVWEALITNNLDGAPKGSSNHNYLIDIDSSINSPSSEIHSGAEGDVSQVGGRNNSLHLVNGRKTTTNNKKDDKRRLVRKTGGLNVKVVNVEDKGERYVGDFFTTLVDVRWRWTLVYFTVSYILSWFLFALIWWVIIRGHGDMDHFEEEGWNPCVVGVKSFASIFLFSLETQHTIGYGYHRMTDECPEAIFLLVVQSIIGTIVESLTVGVFIVKLSRSKKRAQTVVFSKFAVICRKGDALCLMFRVADVGKSFLLEAHIRAQIITKSISKSGKMLLCQQAITVEGDDQDEDRLLLFWPTTLCHEIDEESPLYSMNPTNFTPNCNNQFELVVVLEGIVESTGMTTQARTSYLPSEILWGHQFYDLIQESARTNHTADMELFHSTFPLQETFSYSAKELKEMQETESGNSSDTRN